MEPPLAQIKEYVREKNIDIYAALNIEADPNATSLAFGSNETEAYYQYYLEHSTEIVDWINRNQTKDQTVMSFR